MSEKNKDPTFEDLNPRTLFREFAAECMELAQTTPTPEKRLLYLKMARLWHQIAQRWEKKGGSRDVDRRLDVYAKAEQHQSRHNECSRDHLDERP